MAQSIVIYGRQGCGKSMNAQRLRRHFGLQVVVEWDVHPGQQRFAATEGALVLTNDEGAAQLLNTQGFRLLGFKEAMQLAGFTRNPSQETL